MGLAVWDISGERTLCGMMVKAKTVIHLKRGEAS